jgi:YD repeat-containing protein
MKLPIQLALCVQLVSGWFAVLPAWAQAPPPLLAPKIVPLAPETALLGIHGNTPVDLNAGAANVSVPITDISSGPLRLPVSLSYRSTGIAVNEVASWVGLGWVLNGGGAIMRTVRGLPDFTASDTAVFSFGWSQWLAPPSSITNQELRRRVSIGTIDTEPDEYNVSFAGQSAKIVFDATGVAHILPFATWKVRLVPAAGLYSSYWLITTEDGTRYSFTEVERTKDMDEQEDRAVVTAWHLTEIRSADDAHGISLSYGIAPWHRINPPGKHERVKQYGHSGAVCRGREYLDEDCCPSDPVFEAYTPPAFYDMQSVYLTSIGSETRTVQFFSSMNRADVGVPGDPPAARRLDSILVTDGRQQRFILSHDYFGDIASTQPDRKRLKLTQVQEVGKPAYKFKYNEALGLPPRNNDGQDHWGYSNGAPNSTLIPFLSKRIRSRYIGVGATANRASSFLPMQAWSLARITYPTGGHTSFLYEANIVTTDSDSIPNFGESLPSVSVSADIYVENTDIQNFAQMDDLDLAVRDVLYVQSDEGNGVVPYVDATVLDLPHGAKVVQVYQSCRPPLGGPFPQRYFETLLLPLAVPGPVTAQDITPLVLSKAMRLCLGDATANNGNSSCDTLTVLPPGKYILVAAAHEADSRATLSLELFLNPDPADPAGRFVDRTVGGLRLRQMVDAAGQGDSITKTFTYTRYDSLLRRSVSTGRLFFQPKYSKPTVCGNLVVSAHDLWYLNLLKGGYHIGYDQVTTQVHEGSGGRVETNYLNVEDASARGLVRQEIVQRADGTVSQRKAYDYSRVGSITQVQGFRLEPYELVHTYGYYFGEGQWQFIGSVIYNETPYVHRSDWYQLVSEHQVTYATTTSATTTGGFGIGQRVRYSYRPFLGGIPVHTQPVATRMFLADGTVRSTRRQFAADYSPTTPVTSAPALGIRRLQQAHVQTALVEETSWVRRGNDSTVVGGTLTEYAGLWPRKQAQLQLAAPLPAAQFQASALQNGAFVHDSHYATVATIDRYDARGNALESHRAHDVPTAYLWGYGGTLPIAQAQSCTAQQLAFTSFEPGSSGRWVYDTTFTAGLSPTCRTGNWAYPLQATRQVASRQLPAGSYEVKLWSVGAVRVAVGGLIAPTTIIGAAPGGWQQYHALVQVAANGTVVLQSATGGLVLLDEVRLHPTGALMTTYTHSLLVGLTSQTDATGRTTTYEYDSLGRLVRTRNEQGRILTQQQYHYARP